MRSTYVSYEMTQKISMSAGSCGIIQNAVPGPILREYWTGSEAV